MKSRNESSLESLDNSNLLYLQVSFHVQETRSNRKSSLKLYKRISSVNNLILWGAFFFENGTWGSKAPNFYVAYEHALNQIIG